MPRRFLPFLLLLLFSLSAVAQTAPAQNERHFNFHYAFTVKNVSAGERVRVWIPLAHSDSFQVVKVVCKDGDLPLKQIRQPQYGNEVLFAESSKADKGEYKFSVDYDVVRKEHIVLVNGRPLTGAQPEKAPRIELARFLEPDRLVPVTGVPAQLAEQETQRSDHAARKSA